MIEILREQLNKLDEWANEDGLPTWKLVLRMTVYCVVHAVLTFILTLGLVFTAALIMCKFFGTPDEEE